MYGQVTIYAFIIATLVALAVMWWDLKTMTIPNWLSGGAFVVFLGMILMLLPMDEVIARGIGAGVVLVAGLAMFFTGGMGGGDVKAATAFALLIAPADRGVALLMLAVFGLLGLALFWALRRTPLANGIMGGVDFAKVIPLWHRAVGNVDHIYGPDGPFPALRGTRCKALPLPHQLRFATRGLVIGFC